MRMLTVIANPNPKSFNHAILESFTKGLRAGGHTVEVVDLHAIGFDPRAKMEDRAQFMKGPMPPDVLEQQQKVTQADALVFISPVLWGNVPAMLKGWFDRVFSIGFAIRPPAKGEMGPQGLLKLEKALIINTTLTPEMFYEYSGIGKVIIKNIDDYILKTSGVKKVEHVFFYSVNMVGDEVRKGYLQKAYQLGKEF
jgi:NAD(P)H dehydrogenase (quinone)